MAPVTEVSPMINTLEVADDKMANLSSSGKPPRNLSAMRHCNSTAWLTDSEGDERFGAKSPEGVNSTFQPVFRSGSWSDKGPKRSMEDEFICVDDLTEYIGSSTGAFYGVFDGHGGVDAASFTKKNIMKLDGQLSVARALGDWHIKGAKGSLCPLSCEPELEEIVLTEEDEFLIMGCDGLWDVMSSQCAVTMVRRELMQHNDPERCSQALVKEALQRNSCDNLTVVVVCFSPEPPPRIEIPKSHKRRSISAEGLDLLKGVLNEL